MSIKGRPPWYAPAASSAYHYPDSINNNTTFIAALEAIMSDANDATDEEKVEALAGILDKMTEKHEATRYDAVANEGTGLLGHVGADAGDFGSSSQTMKGSCTIS